MLRQNECRLNFKNRPVRTGDIKGGPKQPPLATNRGSQEPATNRVKASSDIWKSNKPLFLTSKRCHVNHANFVKFCRYILNPRTAGGGGGARRRY